jgi:hypothetical protein
VWWGWHDGATAQRAAKIGANWWFAPLAVCVDHYRELREIADGDEVLGESWWPSTWFPVVIGDCALACDTHVAPGAPTPIRAWYLEDGAPSAVSLPSLGVLVETWTDVLRAGAWQYHTEMGGALVHPEHLPDRGWPRYLP